MTWKVEMKRSIYLDDSVATISSGSASGNVITLKLMACFERKTITYLTGRDWDGKPEHLIYGANGIAAFYLLRRPHRAVGKHRSAPTQFQADGGGSNAPLRK